MIWKMTNSASNAKQLSKFTSSDNGHRTVRILKWRVLENSKIYDFYCSFRNILKRNQHPHCHDRGHCECVLGVNIVMLRLASWHCVVDVRAPAVLPTSAFRTVLLRTHSDKGRSQLNSIINCSDLRTPGKGLRNCRVLLPTLWERLFLYGLSVFSQEATPSQTIHWEYFLFSSTESAPLAYITFI